jgi:beta-lactamase regulating signal transducer with metallopeptidase domain
MMSEINTITGWGAHLFAWFATALVHGLMLFAAVWGAERVGLLTRPGARQIAWRAVLLAPLFSAALQVFVLGGSPVAHPVMKPNAEAAAPVAVTPVAVATPSSVAAEAIAPVAAAPTPLITARGLFITSAVAGWAWAAWVLLAVGRLGLRRLALARYRRRLAPVTDPTTRDIAERLGRRAGLTRLSLLDDPGLASPIALAPAVVVLPSWTQTAFSDLQRTALLAHEVRHLARRDPQWRALTGAVAMAALAPHGALALRRLEDLAEYACDAWSAGQTGAGTPLAECLAACLERGFAGATPVGASAMAKARSPVVDRVRRLIEDRAMGFEANVWLERAGLAAAVGAATLVLPGLAVGHDQVRAAGLAAPAAIAQSDLPAAAPGQPAPEVAGAPRAPLRRGEAAPELAPLPPMTPTPAAPGAWAAPEALPPLPAIAPTPAPVAWPGLPALAPVAPMPATTATPRARLA